MEKIKETEETNVVVEELIKFKKENYILQLSNLELQKQILLLKIGQEFPEMITRNYKCQKNM
uniref:Uncharacterized protein n=1 Tax=viral metagenome TaxID=1070528 RepID=A0A6H1ZVX7_9ZZZZ